MIDIGLDSLHDLSLVDGDLVLIDGIESFAQGLRIRLSFMAGEWFRDSRLGVIDPDSETNVEVMNSRIRTEILEEYGAIRVSKYESGLDYTVRKLTVYFEVETIWGNYKTTEEVTV